MVLSIPTLPTYQKTFVENLISKLTPEYELICIDTGIKDKEFLGWIKAFKDFYNSLNSNMENLTIDFSPFSPAHKDLIITIVERQIYRITCWIDADLMYPDNTKEEIEHLKKDLSVYNKIRQEIIKFKKSNKI